VRHDRARACDPDQRLRQRRRPALGRRPAGNRLPCRRRREAVDLDTDGLGRAVSEPEQVADGEEPGQPPRSRLEPLFQRGLGVPGLFVAVYSAIGFSIYFALGVVADRGLGLTPLIFLVSGLLFVLATLTYVEGGAMIRERGGSSSF